MKRKVCDYHEEIRLTEKEILELGTPRNFSERAFLNYVESCKDMGYGRMMQLISVHWFELDHVGALTTGVCYGQADSRDTYTYQLL